MDRKGEITIFLAMILVSVCALLCGLAESVRTAGARCYLRMAADSAVDSLMAQCHTELWDRYRILGLEFDSQDTLENEMEGFLALHGSRELVSHETVKGPGRRCHNTYRGGWEVSGTGDTGLHEVRIV